MYYNKSNQRLLAEELGRKIKPDSKWGDFCAGGASTSRPPQDRSRTAPPTPDEYQAYQWLLERDDALGAIAAASGGVGQILQDVHSLSNVLGAHFPNANAVHKAARAVHIAVGKSDPEQVGKAYSRVVHEWGCILINIVNDINDELSKAEKEFGRDTLSREFSRYGELSQLLEKPRELAHSAEQSPSSPGHRGKLIRWMRADGQELFVMFAEFRRQKPRIRGKRWWRWRWWWWKIKQMFPWVVGIASIIGSFRG